MRHIKWILAVLFVGFAMPMTASSQVCGDASADGDLDIADIAILIDYLSTSQGQQPTLGSKADCDDRVGITIGDVDALMDYFFVSFDQSRLDCTIQDVYTFPPSLNDTIFLPYMMAIPDGVDQVTLPVITSLEAGTTAFYITALTLETNGPNLFQGTKINDSSSALSTGRFILPNKDSVVMIACDQNAGSWGGALLPGHQKAFEIVFTRTQPGLAAISCPSIVRSEPNRLRTCVAKGGNLYEPVIQYYEVPAPTPQVIVSPSPLAMTSWAGFWSTGTYQVSFTSDLTPVSFNVAPSDSWIVIEDPSPTGYTTPATITVRANASMLASGIHNGQLIFSDINPADAEFSPSALDVVLTVTDPIVYPPGDLNCDGQVSIGDIVLLIDCLFIDTRPVPACE